MDFETSRKKVFRLATLSAAQGNQHAQFFLGISPNVIASAHWLEKSAVLTCWLEKAAKQDISRAQTALANLLLTRAAMQFGSIRIAGFSPVPTACHWLLKAQAIDSFNESAQKTAQDLIIRVNNNCGCCMKRKEGETKMLNCARCKTVCCCGKQCQRKHWHAGHK